jgi:Uncharacterized protein conserved in bacteria
MIYVALLRGINVGGKNIVDMKKLKSTFESLGYTNVVTYINSGNIIFEDSVKVLPVIVHEIEDAIKRGFRLDIRVLVKSFEDINLICKLLPDTWIKNEVVRTDVMFLWEDYDYPEILQQLKINPVDNVMYTPGAVLWNLEYKNYTKSGISKLVGTEIFRNMTVRNVNTVRKLHQLMEQNR